MNTQTTTVSQHFTTSKLILTLGWIALGVAIPQIGLPQAITGPLVNALLLIAVETTGLGSAVLVGLATPLSALAHGALPLPLMVMIPFIGIANTILSTVYSTFRPQSRALALVAAAILKFAWLYGITTWLVSRPLQIATSGTSQAIALPATFVTMLQWPQLATALAGGLIALGLSLAVEQITKKS